MPRKIQILRGVFYLISSGFTTFDFAGAGLSFGFLLSGFTFAGAGRVTGVGVGACLGLKGFGACLGFSVGF